MVEQKRRLDKDRPIRDEETMTVARAVMEVHFTTREGGVKVPGLWWWRGRYWVWEDERWCGLGKEELEDRVWMALEDAWVVKVGKGGESITVRYAADKWKVEGVARALRAITGLPGVGVAPEWLVPGGWDPGVCVGFEDVVLNVETGETKARGPTWFDPSIVPVRWDERAGCPTWDRCLGEWSQGDAGWVKLLQMWVGYCLLGRKRYAKWLLMYGKIRGGKGTICSVIRGLVGGAGPYMEMSLHDMAGDFGLDGVEHAKVLVVSEVEKVDGWAGAKCCRFLKNVVGEDLVTVNVKHQRQLRNVRVECAPMMSGNDIPVLPNEGRGLSGKMLSLPIQVGFEGREDVRLKEKLEGEREGIAAWAVRGAKMVVDGERWPTPSGAEEVLAEFHAQNNPFDDFLAARFTPNPKGWVERRVLRREWEKWVKEQGVTRKVPWNRLIRSVVRESSWALREVRPRGEDGTRDRGIEGLSLLKEPKE